MNSNPSMAGLASLVQSRGRGDDSVLVHMTPGELKGLQNLAFAHGGSLTLNPDTGLYEAGFLKKLLPTLIGAILTPLSGGLINPFTAGLLVGGVEGIRTGDLGKGLMAGLGAFGGAGLSSALAGAGSAAASGAGELVKTAGTEAAAAAAKEGATQAAQEAAKQAAMKELAAKKIAEQTATKGIFSRLPEGVASFKNIGAGIGEIAGGGANLGGIGALNTAGAAFNALPGGMIGKAGLTMTAANALSPDMEVPEGGAYDIDDSYYEGNQYDPSTGSFSGGRWRKGYPGFPGYAMGGSVMPRTNFNYPQAGITKSSYAPNMEYSRPKEVLDGYEAKIDPFTGEEKFANGGEVGMMAPENLKNFLTVSPGAPMSTSEVGVAPGAGAGDPMINLTNTSYTAPPPAPPQSLQQYYQSLLAPPQQQSYDPSFFQYMQSLNNYVTSPVAPPPAPVTPPTQPTKPDDGRNQPPYRTQPFDPSNIDFSKIDFSNFNFGDFMGGQYGDINQYLTGGTGGDSRMVWDPAKGAFVTQTPTRSTTGTQTPATGNQNQYDPSQYRYNPFEDGFDYENYLDKMGRKTGDIQQQEAYAFPGPTDQIAYEDNAYMANQLPADFMNSYLMRSPSERSEQVPDFSQFDYAGGTPGFDMGNVNIGAQMGDMGGYGTQFQGFQPLPTDFGSTYQAPAMNTPMFGDSNFYAPPQQMDFGSMGNYGLGALGSTYSAPTFQMPSMDFTSQTPSVPITSTQAPITTGAMSTGETAPQFGFGNSNVLYGQSNFGQGGEQNIFGFAEGGSIQKAAAGKLVTGDGDGMSDDIRANINGDQEARLADGEFVIPADVVSHLGNGSTDAGADRLYSMMDRIRKARTGRTQQAPEVDADKYLPA